MPVCHSCGEKFPTWAIVEGKPRNLGNRNRCLTCQPFQIGRRPLRSRQPPVAHPCALCRNTFVGRGRLCGSCTQKVHRYRAKMAGIKMLGGVCAHCGWTGKPAGFQFHHPDENKEFNVSSSLNRKWSVVQAEIQKCRLLCATCHTIEHSDQDGADFLREVASYRGRGLDFK